MGEISPRNLMAVLAAVAFLGGPPSAAAGVHDGGVGACNVCHTMHEGNPAESGSLLLASSPSDLCLNCHASEYGAVLGTDPLMPPPERGPGNFVFLWSDNLNDGPNGAANPISGDGAGHNLNAPGHGLAADGTRLHSPGGSYPAASLQCTSCHDPHGNTNYRFLWGPEQNSSFMYPAPTAVGLDVQLGGVESNGNHVAYRSGVDQWCGNCHGGYLQRHNSQGSGFGHQTDRPLDAAVLSRYDTYNGTADPTGGVAATAYLAAVPFEDLGNYPARTSGPTTGSRLMCLTCHRAHASSAPAAGRWDFKVARLGDDGVISGSYPLPNPYLNANQQPLCRKCHPRSGHAGDGIYPSW